MVAGRVCGLERASGVGQKAYPNRPSPMRFVGCAGYSC